MEGGRGGAGVHNTEQGEGRKRQGSGSVCGDELKTTCWRVTVPPSRRLGIQYQTRCARGVTIASDVLPGLQHQTDDVV